jgi:hypothetical protein
VRASTLALVVLFLAAVANATPCRLRAAPFLETASGARTLDLRDGQSARVFAVVPAWVGGRAVTLSDSGLAGRVRFSSCPDAIVHWQRVEPLLHHTHTASPNADISVFANAVVFGPRHGAWIGFDPIEQIATPLDDEGSSLLVREARPSASIGAPDRGACASLGVMRLAASVHISGETRATPADLEHAFRYTVREGDDFIGWLTSFFNVPYLFGSAGRGARAQAERYYGADCADVLVAALRRTGVAMEYTSVTGLIERMPRRGGPVEITPCDGTTQQGCGASSLRWDEDVRRGDLLVLDYVDAEELPRPWDHVVALVEDRGPDGRPDGLLGPEDLVVDSGDQQGLKIAPLAQQGHVRVQVLRPPVPRRGAP